MALEFVVDAIEAVPESARKFYAEKDGKFHLDETLAENIRGLKSALEAEKSAAKERAKALKEMEAKYSGIDPDEARKWKTMIETNEEARLLSENKFEEAFQRRTEKLRLAEEAKRKELEDRVKAAEAKAKAFEMRVLENEIRSAGMAAGLNPQGMRDSMLLAKTIFTLDSNGRAVQLDPDGNVVLGRDGKTPFSPQEFYEVHRTESPNWYIANSTGSPHPGKAGQAGGKTMKRSVFDALSPTEKAATIRSGVKVVD